MEQVSACLRPYFSGSLRIFLFTDIYLMLVNPSYPGFGSIGLAVVPVFLQMKKRLGFYLAYFPDLAWIAILGGAFAGMWACLHTILLMRELRKPRT